MKRKLISIFTCVMVLLNLIVAGAAQATPLIADASPNMPGAETQKIEDVVEQLQAEFLPQLESILTPDQREQFKAVIADKKTSFRKAFKAITLTPEQKTKLAATFKSFPETDTFTSLTPEQKKQFFMKKKELFMPSGDEIAEFKAKKGQ